MTATELGTERREILERVGERTLVDVFMATCAANGGRPALIAKEGEDFRTRTWAEYRFEASRLAAALRRRGVDHGGTVALMMTNRPEHVIADVATLIAGATPVSVYNTLAPEQIAYIGADSAARVAIVEDAAMLARWLEVRSELPGLTTIVVVDTDGAELPEGVESWDALIAEGEALLPGAVGELENAWRAVRPDDAVTIIYTSGTTGPPKGVVLTHRNLLYMLEVVGRLLEIAPGQAGISYLPLAHVAERMVTHYVGIRFAGSVTFVRDLADVLESLQNARPQTFMAVPRVWEKFHARLLQRIEEMPERRRALAERAIAVGLRRVRLEMAGEPVPPTLRAQSMLFDRLVFARIREGLGLDRLRYAVSGAAPIGAELLEFFAAIGVPILEVYGMTETTAVLTANRPGRIRIGTVGQALPGVELAIADDGEVLARGPNIMPGYLHRDEATAETIDADGWLHTGDLGRIDDAGYLTIVGRKKELIITAGGKNLAPNNIEAQIKPRSPLIGQVCAIGDRRPYLVALVVLDGEVLPGWFEARGIPFEGQAAAAAHPAVRAEVERAIDEGNEHLANPERVRRFAILPDEWTAESDELTPSLKLKRSVIAERHAEAIEALYAEPVAPAGQA